jgi:putative flippase GtrA
MMATRVLNTQRIGRFLIVGLTCVFIDAAIYWLLLEASLAPGVSKTFSFLGGAAFAYFANWRFTFRSERSRHSVILFIIVYASSLVINVVGNGIALSILNGFEYRRVISFVVVTAVTTVWNYLGMSLFVFHEKGTKNK